MTNQPTNCHRGELRFSALDDLFLGLEPAYAEMHVGHTRGLGSAPVFRVLRRSVLIPDTPVLRAGFL